MRQNGLRASSFVAVADVDPRIADQLLDLLAFAHVAAYAEPVPGHVGVYRDHHVPTRPIDRLWVDREATGPAREVLDRSLAHLHAELETAIAEGVLAGGTAPVERRSHPSVRAPGGPVVDAPSSAGPATEGPGTDRPGGGVPVGSGEEPTVAEQGPVPVDGVALSGAVAPGSAAAPAPGANPPVDASARDAQTRDTPTRDDGALVDEVPAGAGTTGAGGAPTAAADSTADEATAERPPAHDAELDQAAVDARWRDIVAGWDGPAADGGGSVTAPPAGRRGAAPTPPAHPLGFGTPWPASAPPAPQPGDRRRTDRGPVDPARRRENRVDGPVDLPGPRDHVPDDEHFSPPAPTVHPPLEKTTRLGWAGLVAGLVVLVVVVAVGSDMLPRWVPLLGVALLVGGFAALVSRLHRSPEDEDDHDPDDGAVV